MAMTEVVVPWVVVPWEVAVVATLEVVVEEEEEEAMADAVLQLICFCRQHSPAASFAAGYAK